MFIVEIQADNGVWFNSFETETPVTPTKADDILATLRKDGFKARVRFHTNEEG
jgi:hypothetical protein